MNWRFFLRGRGAKMSRWLHLVHLENAPPLVFGTVEPETLEQAVQRKGGWPQLLPPTAKIRKIESRLFTGIVSGYKQVPLETPVKNGDLLVRKDGTTAVCEAPHRKPFKLQLGDVVHRHLQDGDWVMINRQPTLHVGSMIGVRVKRQPTRRSIGTALNHTTPLNMDYDGRHCHQQ